MNDDLLKTLKAILSGGGGSKTDGGAFTPASDTATPIEGVRQDTVTQVADGKYGVVRISPNRALKTDSDTAYSKTIDSIQSRPEATTYLNITASTLVRTGTGILVGMYVNSTSAGTIKFWDQTSAAVPVLNNTITPAIGYHVLGNASFLTGLYATIGGTLDVTLYYIPTP